MNVLPKLALTRRLRNINYDTREDVTDLRL